MDSEKIREIIYCSEVGDAVFWIALCFLMLVCIAVFQFVRILHQLQEGREVYALLEQLKHTAKAIQKQTDHESK